MCIYVTSTCLEAEHGSAPMSMPACPSILAHVHQVEFIMPKDAADLMQRQIAQGSDGIDEVIESLSQVDSEEAKAWKIEDEIKVNLITMEGFQYDSMCIR